MEYDRPISIFETCPKHELVKYAIPNYNNYQLFILLHRENKYLRTFLWIIATFYNSSESLYVKFEIRKRLANQYINSFYSGFIEIVENKDRDISIYLGVSMLLTKSLKNTGNIAATLEYKLMLKSDRYE